MAFRTVRVAILVVSLFMAVHPAQPQVSTCLLWNTETNVTESVKCKEPNNASCVFYHYPKLVPTDRGGGCHFHPHGYCGPPTHTMKENPAWSKVIKSNATFVCFCFRDNCSDLNAVPPNPPKLATECWKFNDTTRKENKTTCKPPEDACMVANVGVVGAFLADVPVGKYGLGCGLTATSPHQANSEFGKRFKFIAHADSVQSCSDDLCNPSPKVGPKSKPPKSRGKRAAEASIWVLLELGLVYVFLKD